MYPEARNQLTERRFGPTLKNPQVICIEQEHQYYCGVEPVDVSARRSALPNSSTSSKLGSF